MTDDLIGRAEAQTAIQFAARRYTVAHEAHGEGQVVWGDNLINVTDAMNVLRDLLSAQPEPEAVFEWKREFKEYIESLDITRDDWKGIIEYIDELPSAEPDTTNHDSIPAETGKNDGDRTSGDCISRQQALETIRTMQTYKLFAGDDMLLIDQAQAQTELMMLPSAQPERKTGRWIEMLSTNHTYKCSECGRLLVNVTDGKNNVSKHYPYCHCGADMRGEENEID